MNSYKEIFETLRGKQFLETRTTLNPNGGIRHRLAGKGTNKFDKNTELTEEDKAILDEALLNYANQIINFINNKPQPHA